MYRRNLLALAWQHAHEQTRRATPGRLRALTKAEARTLEAAAARIIPSGADGPGAREAGVLWFIDYALAHFARSDRALYRDGLAALAAKRFAALDDAAQDRELTAIENTPFFETLRTHVMWGMFGNPEYGGNRDKAGWKLIGFDDTFVFTPPFGEYEG